MEIIFFSFYLADKSFGEDPFTSYDSLDKYNYALETLKLTDNNNICRDDGEPTSHALVALNNCMLQPKCRQPVYVHNENGRRIDPPSLPPPPPPTIGHSIEITPQLPPRPPLPRSPSSVSTKDMEKQQQLSDWYYIKTNSKSPLPPPRPDKRNGTGRAAAEPTIKQIKSDGIYVKNPKVLLRDANKNINQHIYYPCVKRDDHSHLPIGNCNKCVASTDNDDPDDILCKYNAKQNHNNNNIEQTLQQVNGFSQWHRDKQILVTQSAQQQLDVHQFHVRQQQKRIDTGTLTPPPPPISDKHPTSIVKVQQQQQLYEELVHPSQRLPLSSRYGELSSSSFEHVNVSNYLSSATPTTISSSSTTDVPTTVADKRFNKSTGNFADEQQMATANDTEHLQRKAVAVSQPIQRRRPPPPPIPTTMPMAPVATIATVVAVPSANTQNVSSEKKKHFTLTTMSGKITTRIIRKSVCSPTAQCERENGSV